MVTTTDGGETAVQQGLPAWIGPLVCGDCARPGTLELVEPPPAGTPDRAAVRCLRCGWSGGLWQAELATLDDAIAEANERRRHTDHPDHAPAASQPGGRRAEDPPV